MVQTTLSSWKSNASKSTSAKPIYFKPVFSSDNNNNNNNNNNTSQSASTTPSKAQHNSISRSKLDDEIPSSSSSSSSSSPTNQTPRPISSGNSRFPNKDLRAICRETKEILPDILDQVPNLHVGRSEFHHMSSWELGLLQKKDCPGFALQAPDNEAGRKGTRIRVFDQDSFDAALDLQPGTTVSSIIPDPGSESESEPGLDVDTDTQMSNTQESDTQESSTTPSSSTFTPAKPVAVLNLASERHPGGGWENGALAQEEALCYRSSLSLSFRRSYYPIPLLGAIYSPTVLLIRDAISRGHTLLYPATPATHLPVTSVITVAALRCPQLDQDGRRFYRNRDRETTKKKIRGTLRMAVLKGHTKIVLGALGCGAFENPPEDIAQCFVDVFDEDEFHRGWFEDIVFAILDNVKGSRGGKDGDGNYGIFYRALHGMVV